MSEEPRQEIRHIPKVELLFEENIPKFNQMVAQGQAPDLRNCNLSNLDLREANLTGLDLTGCYMRACNLRGIDFTGCNLHGASMQGAMISGAFFPEDVPMHEVLASVQFGTRIRVSPERKNMKLIMVMLREIMKHLEQNETQ